jgi:superfamily II DNA/RNA helicase
VARVAEELEERGFAAAAIHGDLGQGAREQALRAFRNGKVDVLVATDVAARGIDVDGVTHVINYQCPEDETTYLHRIGRTARAGTTGTAITFVDWDEVHRWGMISLALDLGMPEAVETYSSSAHLYTDLDIPEGIKGTLPRADRTRAGLDAETLEDLGETGRGPRRGRTGGASGSGGAGRSGGRSGRGRDHDREHDRDREPAAVERPVDEDAPARAERTRRTRQRRRLRGGVPIDHADQPDAIDQPDPIDQGDQPRVVEPAATARESVADVAPVRPLGVGTLFLEPGASEAVAAVAPVTRLDAVATVDPADAGEEPEGGERPRRRRRTSRTRTQGTAAEA